MGRRRVETRLTCSISECEIVAYSRGWCHKHYNRWRKHGDPEHDRYKKRLPSPEAVTNIAAFGRKLGVSRQRAHQLLYKDRTSARHTLNEAVQDGKILKPQVCVLCHRPTEDLEAHHFDYSLPLAVLWVCVSCHNAVHPHGRDAIKKAVLEAANA